MCTPLIKVNLIFYLFSNVDIRTLRHEAEFYGISPLGKYLQENAYSVIFVVSRILE